MRLCMSPIQNLFPTLLYRADLPSAKKLNLNLGDAAVALSQNDAAGRRWCEKHGYPGYTSFASQDDLTNIIPAFKHLVKALDRHAAVFCKELEWDVRGGKPICDSIWVNVMPEGGSHTSHIHTNSVISGTYYVAVPEGSGPIVFEDPRHAMMMAAPQRLKNAPREMKSHVSETPAAGTILMWESWLRHEVPLNKANGLRISISFNYVIGPR